jgi:hypothetical protein
MRTSGSIGRTAIAFVSMAALLFTPGGALAAWMQVPTSAAGSAAADADWPRRYTAPDGAQVVLYEPQVASWEDQTLLRLHAAVAYTPKGASAPQLGTIIAEARTRVSVAERLVDFSSFGILQSNFPNAPREVAAEAVRAIKASIPLGERVLALDRVLAYVDASRIRPTNVEGLKADPPVVFYSTRPAVIVNVDGDPIWSPIQGSDLRFAVNTNWDLFEHPPSKTYYLRHDTVWLKAAAVSGPWTGAGPLPASFAKLPADDNWKDVRAALPGRTVAAAALPTVFVSLRPAELILLRGEPQYVPVPGTTLLWVRNTEADLFRVGRGGPVYYVVAGRWFSAPGFNGPWTFATPTLPADFKAIPLEHERSRVLASVPGTVQAAEAVLLAQVPQTARVSKKMVQAPDVTYQGEPEFQAIEATTVARATNTDKDIFKIGTLYYMCFQGVWFASTAPSGPWEVTGSVPEQIYEIPVSSPSHHVTYVTVEDDDDEWVVYAAAAAYTGVMVAWGCAVWGTGYYYPPYIGYGGYYPAYFPHYPTYGYGAAYNPWTGSYGRGAAVYGPYGGAGVGARYNPRTGTYARGAAAYGPYGARGVAQAYNPRTGTSAATRQGSGVYGSWGSTGVSRGDQWASTARVSNRATGTTTRATGTSGGAAAVSRRGPQGGGFVGTGGGDVYAGRDGNVYQKQGDSWQRLDGGGGSGVDRSAQGAADRAQRGTQPTATPRADASTMGQLNRDAAARSAGAQRTRDASSVRSGSSARSGSYRPSGGMRAGGGRRR